MRPDRNLHETVDYWKNNFEDYFDQNYETCDGDVVVKILAVDEPYFGGSSAKLSVEFKCKKCGCTHYSELPNEYNINEWLNKILKEMR